MDIGKGAILDNCVVSSLKHILLCVWADVPACRVPQTPRATNIWQSPTIQYPCSVFKVDERSSSNIFCISTAAISSRGPRATNIWQISVSTIFCQSWVNVVFVFISSCDVLRASNIWQSPCIHIPYSVVIGTYHSKRLPAIYLVYMSRCVWSEGQEGPPEQPISDSLPL